MATLFDEAELLDRIDHDWEFLGETVEMLVADGPALIQELRQAMHASDAAAVGRAAHTLKGMIANFCAPVPLETAFTLERLGRPVISPRLRRCSSNWKPSCTPSPSSCRRS